MEHDQAFYDLLFQLRGVVIFLAREAREQKARSQELAIRALRAEVRARNLEIERDYWKAREERRLQIRADWRQRRRAA